MIFLLLFLVLLPLALVIYQQLGPVRYTRGTKHPHLLFGSDGSVKVDFAHPSMRKRIIEACEAVERMHPEIRRAPR